MFLSELLSFGLMTINKYLVIFLLLLIGCSRSGLPNVNVTVPVSSNPTLAASEPSQVEDPPRDTALEDIAKLPDYPAQPVLKGSPSPDTGILISPRNAAEAALNAAEATRLLTENSILNRTQSKELLLRDAYQKRLEDENASLKKKSLWDKNGTAIMFGIGVATGVTVSLAIFKLAVKIAAPTP